MAEFAKDCISRARVREKCEAKETEERKREGETWRDEEALVVSGLVKHRARKDTEVLLVDEEDIYRVRK